MTETAKGPITGEVVIECLPESKNLPPIVFDHLIDGLNDLIGQLASVWGRTDLRETQCGLLLADEDGHDARILSRAQCSFECAGNGLPVDYCVSILSPMPPGQFMVVIATQRMSIIFGLPVMMIRLKPGSENN